MIEVAIWVFVTYFVVMSVLVCLLNFFLSKSHKTIKKLLDIIDRYETMICKLHAEVIRFKEKEDSKNETNR